MSSCNTKIPITQYNTSKYLNDDSLLVQQSIDSLVRTYPPAGVYTIRGKKYSIYLIN